MRNQVMLGCAGVPDVGVVAFEQRLPGYTTSEPWIVIFRMPNQAMLGCAGVPEVDVLVFEQLLRGCSHGL